MLSINCKLNTEIINIIVGTIFNLKSKTCICASVYMSDTEECRTEMCLAKEFMHHITQCIMR